MGVRVEGGCMLAKQRETTQNGMVSFARRVCLLIINAVRERGGGGEGEWGGGRGWGGW